MITVFLAPYPFRGHQAPDLWFFYKVLTSVKEPVHFILSKDYFNSVEYWQERFRWEPKEYNQRKHGYTLPTQQQLDNCQFTLLDEAFFEQHLQNYANPTEFYKAWLTEDIPELRQKLKYILANISHPEAVLVWNNCASLNLAAEALNIPVVHFEQGSLRLPDYFSTFFFDFQGVNGSAEAESRYLNAAEECKQQLSVNELRHYFSKALHASPAAPEYDIGVALQVENDSNLVAYGNSFNNFTLLEYMRVKHHATMKKIIVRPHPYALFTPNAKASFQIDSSPCSNDFISRCHHIVTVNSGVALEAILLNKEVTILGEGPFKFIAEAENEAEKCRRLYFYLFAYLVPYELLLDMDYLRFRLSKPKDSEIIHWHKSCYETQKALLS
ncbi:GT99 family glycosyltransferase N-terminal domain-containing protein [Pseudescherichia sp.]|uniref:GT99 family glycosyltransferase N-terminal domain-containing protein n=1 Tax=Pseudescherichia sp. TaxID=2055881 RepID=UPI00289E8F13|nr:hypothetical protein [Pseudescherichia sp.]